MRCPTNRGRLTSEPLESSDDGDWVGTITTEGNVTTVVNESGSVWGGTATLIEEMSIGVELGEQPYLLGHVAGIWAHDDRVYVVDSQVPTVRVFTSDGEYLMDVGARGEGPGEYTSPNSVAVAPNGTIFVREGTLDQRINVYAPDGGTIDTWYGDRRFGTNTPPTLTFEGDFYTQTYVNQDSARADRTMGMGKAGPDGIEGIPRFFPDIDFEPSPRLALVGNAQFYVPLRPHASTLMMPSGAMVAGHGGEYRYVLARPDGTEMIVEKHWAPLQVDAKEAEWRRRNLVASARRFDPEWQWDGKEIPDHRGAITAFLPDRSGRIWVLRPGDIERVDDCTEDPLAESAGTIVSCWFTVYVVDVFDEVTGSYLGEVELPRLVTLTPSFIDGDIVFTRVEDESGTVMVKRYRLVLPGEENQ